jgi:hypothetical protein
MKNENAFEKFFRESQLLAKIRIRRKKIFADELIEDEPVIGGKENFKASCFYVVLGCKNAKGNRSTLTIFQVQDTFESKLNELSQLYKDYVNRNNFIAQMKLFKDFYKSRIVPNPSSPKDTFSYIFRTNSIELYSS